MKYGSKRLSFDTFANHKNGRRFKLSWSLHLIRIPYYGLIACVSIFFMYFRFKCFK